jgi:hypothetical protein
MVDVTAAARLGAGRDSAVRWASERRKMKLCLRQRDFERSGGMAMIVFDRNIVLTAVKISYNECPAGLDD